MNVVQQKIGQALAAISDIPEGDLPAAMIERYRSLRYEVAVLYFHVAKASQMNDEGEKQ
jgi:hypothetical protein